MSGFTLAYLSQLGFSAAGAAVVLGFLVLFSLAAWKRILADAKAEQVHRAACAHLIALAGTPLIAALAVHLGVANAAGPRTAAIAAEVGDGWTTSTIISLALAAVWMAGAALMLARLALDGWRLKRLSRTDAPQDLVRYIHELATAASPSGPPLVAVADVRGPQVIGLLAPTILLPPDLLADLSKDERRAVLLHELAHVARSDFGWNLAQRLLLAVLWFAPPAWALYREVTDAREMRCDALAVRAGASPASLARALVRLAEGPGQTSIAMGWNRESQLSGRVERLLGCRTGPRPAGRPGVMALAAPPLCLLLVGVGAVRIGDQGLRDLYWASDLAPIIRIQARDPAGSFALSIRQGRVVAAAVERRPLPARAIRQSGQNVVLLDERDRPALRLRVTPHGRVAWEARR